MVTNKDSRLALESILAGDEDAIRFAAAHLAEKMGPGMYQLHLEQMEAHPQYNHLPNREKRAMFYAFEYGIYTAMKFMAHVSEKA